MSIAISEEHRALAQTVAGLLTKHQSRAAARSLLEGGTEQLPAFWAELGGLGREQGASGRAGLVIGEEAAHGLGQGSVLFGDGDRHV